MDQAARDAVYAAAVKKGNIAPYQLTKAEYKIVKRYAFDNKNAEYHVRYSDNIEADLKRGWSSWNFGQLGFKGARSDLIEAIERVKQGGGGEFDISGFSIWVDENSKIDKDLGVVYLDDYEFRELDPGYWVAVDNINAAGGVSSHRLPGDLGSVGDAVSYIQKNKALIDGTGSGESFDPTDSRVIYSDGDMHIIEAGENTLSQYLPDGGARPYQLTKAEISKQQKPPDISDPEDPEPGFRM